MSTNLGDICDLTLGTQKKVNEIVYVKIQYISDIGSENDRRIIR